MFPDRTNMPWGEFPTQRGVRVLQALTAPRNMDRAPEGVLRENLAVVEDHVVNFDPPYGSDKEGGDSLGDGDNTDSDDVDGEIPGDDDGGVPTEVESENSLVDDVIKALPAPDDNQILAKCLSEDAHGGGYPGFAIEPPPAAMAGDQEPGGVRNILENAEIRVVPDQHNR